MAEALRLADRLEGRWALHPDMQEAAAELRRLHELLEAEQTLHQRVIYPELQRLRAQRDALLEALKSTCLFLHHCWCDVQMNDYSFEKLNRQMEIVDAAIKAVEGEKNNG